MNPSAIHRRLIRILEEEDFERHLPSLSDMPFSQLFRSLLSALCSREEKIKWRAVTTLGHWVARMADEDMEAGRNAFRRLLWMLNEESGGIGWGVPEAMGDILARHEELAKEYAPILVSYARPNGNFLEYEPLQAGLAWAFGRLAEDSPERLQTLDAHRYLLPYLRSPNAGVRGMAAWALGRLGAKKDLGSLRALRGDEAPCLLYEKGRLTPRTVQDLAQEAIARIEARSVPDR
jgi:HEAT repeat protein